MKEKIYELVTKMYIKMQKGFSGLREQITDVNGEICNIKGDINYLKKGHIKLENNLKEFKNALFDGYTHTCERLDSLEYKVDKLTATVESHDVKIEVIRGTK